MSSCAVIMTRFCMPYASLVLLPFRDNRRRAALHLIIPVRRHAWRWTSERERDKPVFFVWLQCQGSAVSKTTKLETHVRMCSHPTSDLLHLVTIGSLATHQSLAQLVNRFLRYGDWVHVRTCRDAPPHPWLVESTYLVTPNPHTKFELNGSSRSWDIEARCARAHVQRYPTHDMC